MKMKGRKVTSFITINIELLAIYFITLFKTSDILSTVGVACIAGLITNTIIFIGGNTYDKWIRSKYYNKTLGGYNEENN